jgi:hypothetical protein
MAEVQPLPADVVATITALLPTGTPGRERLLRQLPHTSLGRACGCGCVTVDLVVERSAVAAVPVSDRRNPAASASAGRWAGTGTGILLLTEDGYLACLEAYSSSGEPVTAWPPPHLPERDDE